MDITLALLVFAIGMVYEGIKNHRKLKIARRAVYEYNEIMLELIPLVDQIKPGVSDNINKRLELIAELAKRSK